MSTAGSIVIDLLMKTGSFVTDAQRAEKAMKGLQTTAKSVRTGITQAFAGIAAGIAAGLSIGAVVNAFTTGINAAIASADRLDELSARFGTSTEQLSAWGYAAKMTGSDIEGLAGVIPKFSKSIADAADEGSEAAKIFKALGIAVKDQAGNLRSYEELLPEVADRFKALDNVTTETAVAMQLFGRSGSEFLEFLNLGSDGLQRMEDRARALGIVIDGETAGAAAEFNDRLDDLRAATGGWFTQIAAQLLPTMTDLVEKMTDFVKEGGSAKEIADSVAEALRGISSAADGFGNVLSWLDRLRGALAGLELQGNAAFQSLNPMNWNRSDLERLGAQYGRGTTMIEQGWEASQPAASSGTAIPEGARTGPRGRRTRATSAEVEESRAYAARLKAAEEYQKKLNAILNGEGGGAKGSSKTEAEKQAEALERAYQSAADALDRQIELHGDASQAARTRYEIEHGALQGLDEERQRQLLADAEIADILEDITALEQVWAESAAEVTREAERRKAAFERVNQDILDQIDLLGMTRDEQEQWNAIAWAGVDATSEQGKDLLANVQRMQALRDAKEDQISAMDAVRDAGADFFVDWTSGAKSFKDSALDALDSLRDRILSMIAENLMDQLFGKRGDAGGGQWGDWIGTAFGALFGGARAGGGDVSNGRAYLVGEEGPEMFVPRTAGTVIPADRTAAMMGVGRSGGNVTNNFAFSAPTSTKTQTQVAARVGYEVRRAQRLGA